jgi:hypothetical protein
MEVQFGVKIEYWLLPYVNLVVDCLQAQSPAAALPHLVGIFTGHVYHFFSVVWPKMGGRRWLAAPRALRAAYEPKAAKKPKAAAAAAAKHKAPPLVPRKTGGSKLPSAEEVVAPPAKESPPVAPKKKSPKGTKKRKKRVTKR